MKTRCGRELPLEKIPLHVARCTACGGKPPQAIGTKHPVDYFSDQEAQDIILHCEQKHWQMFYWILYETGARVGEVLQLTRKDLLPTCELGLWTEKIKPKVYESVPISTDLFDELSIYSGKRGRFFPFRIQAASKALKRAAYAAGIIRPVHTHMFRHGLVRRIGKLQGLTAMEALTISKKILRHKHMATTMVYAESTEREAKETHRKLLEE